ncbi:hypothetical protein GFS31_40830 (plasmid) [Leptolyngbya sp. BL0902]|uniref:hypothetical protein n=1 Tax=Leptolyngbya sp. BL0902 TaxID=1115757 RepID=UPI0018E84660|nr:hypothetical protein [Leptolyngbya sp. BL0902]QQE67370.1 hypothetical protein GFS31_40830 [Leptolyngbya sp. BL0902]
MLTLVWFQLPVDWHLLQLGAEEGSDILRSSIELSQGTIDSWNQAWIEVFGGGPTGLWTGVVRLGLILGALSLLYLAVKDGSQIVERGSWLELVRMFVWPLVIVFFLANNAALLSGSILLIRGIAHEQVRAVLDVQLADLTFADAMSRQGISAAAETQLINLYADCMGLPPEELLACRVERTEEANAILDRAEAEAGTTFDLLRQSIAIGTQAVLGPAGVVLAPRTFIEDSGLQLVRVILYALQWMVVNLLEAALLLTALFAPVAMGLSLLPFQGRLIFAWLVGFLSLFGVQFGYNLVVGLVANRLGQTATSTLNDLGFALLLAIGAPVVAGLVAKGGGVAVYSGLQSTVARINGAFVGTAALGVRSAFALRMANQVSSAGSPGTEGANALVRADDRRPTTG